MTTVDLITALFYEVDEKLRAIPKHPEAHLWPSDVVTLGLLHALKGGGNHLFYRWLTRDSRALFPRLPERTRLCRLLKTHHDWTQGFLAAPTVLGGIDTYRIEIIHPIREGRSSQQIGRKGLSNHRWIVRGKRCLVLNQWGLIVAWVTANAADNTLQWLVCRILNASTRPRQAGATAQGRRSVMRPRSWSTAKAKERKTSMPSKPLLPSVPGRSPKTTGRFPTLRPWMSRRRTAKDGRRRGPPAVWMETQAEGG